MTPSDNDMPPAAPNEKAHGGPTACVLTLGCKVNQFDSAGIGNTLIRAGYTLVQRGTPADLTVINTCTVTHKADLEVRGLIRRAKRLNPNGKVIVTGCMAQVRPDELTEMPEVDLVLGQSFKADVLKSIRESGGQRLLLEKHDSKAPLQTLEYPEFGRTRAFFRVQDGCSAVCTYCTVPKARGPSRSLPLGPVLDGLKHYYRNGCAEIVLTGIHLGAWGPDLDPSQNFEKLLARALEGEGARLRISSIEPNEVTDPIIRMSETEERLCPHFHLPLQSGSDRILTAMKRPYSAGFFKDLVMRLTGGRPDFCVGVDVLTGFPGEDEAAYEETASLIEELPVAYLHVFPYSKRPGTVAAGLPGQVPETVKKERVAALREIGMAKRRAFHQRCLGSIRPTLIENTPDRSTGLPRGLTDNYISVLIESGKAPRGKIVPVRLLKHAPGDKVYGERTE